MPCPAPSFKFKLITLISVLALTGFILKTNYIEAAPIIQNGNKFANFDADPSNNVMGTSTSAPYQDVSGDVHISGNVGIGTTTLIDKLNLDGGNFAQNAPANWRDAYKIFRGETPKSSIGTDITGNKLQFFTGLSNLILADDSTSRLTIDSSGNVGVGTNVPSFPLDVNGLVKMNGFRLGSAAIPGYVLTATGAGDGTGTWQPAPNGGGGSTAWSSLTDPTANLTLNMSTRLTTFNWGTLGNADNLFTLADTANDQGWGYLLNVYTRTGSLHNPLRISAAGKESILVNQNGAVGIGTTNIPSGTTMTVGNKYLHIRSTGEVGIGTTTPLYELQLSADSAGKPNGGSWSNTSDMRLKKNIQPITSALDRISQLKGVNFEWINPTEHGNMIGTQGGFIAQDIEKAFPAWITKISPSGKDTDLIPPGDKIESLSLPFEFDALVVESIKEQQQQIKKLKDEVKILKKEIEALKTK